MDKILPPDVSAEGSDECRDAEWYLQSLRQMIEKMRSDRQDIQRLREERQKTQDHTDEVMAKTWEIIHQIRATR